MADRSIDPVGKGLCLFRAIKDYGNPDDALEAFILTVKYASDGQVSDALFEMGPRRLMAVLNRAPPVRKALREFRRFLQAVKLRDDGKVNLVAICNGISDIKNETSDDEGDIKTTTGKASADEKAPERKAVKDFVKASSTYKLEELCSNKKRKEPTIPETQTKKHRAIKPEYTPCGSELHQWICCPPKTSLSKPVDLEAEGLMKAASAACKKFHDKLYEHDEENKDELIELNLDDIE